MSLMISKEKELGPQYQRSRHCLIEDCNLEEIYFVQIYVFSVIVSYFVSPPTFVWEAICGGESRCSICTWRTRWPRRCRGCSPWSRGAAGGRCHFSRHSGLHSSEQSSALLTPSRFAESQHLTPRKIIFQTKNLLVFRIDFFLYFSLLLTRESTTRKTTKSNTTLFSSGKKSRLNLIIFLSTLFFPGNPNHTRSRRHDILFRTKSHVVLNWRIRRRLTWSSTSEREERGGRRVFKISFGISYTSYTPPPIHLT